MHRVTNRRVRSSGVDGKLNGLLKNAVQGCPAVQEGQRPIVLLLHVVVLVDDLRVDVGDYVDGVLLRGERDLEVDILRRDGGQSQGHQCVEEVVTIVAVEAGRHHRAWARRLEAYIKVVRELLDDCELVEEADKDLVEQGDEVVVQVAPRPGGLKHGLETFLGAGPQAGVMDHLAQQDTINIITHVYVQIIHKDYYMQEEDDRMLAFLDRRATLDGIV